MDDFTLTKILNEIDTMTTEEYWNLFNESQKLPAFFPVLDFSIEALGNDFLGNCREVDWVAIPAKASVVEKFVLNGVSFPVGNGNYIEKLDSKNSSYSKEEETLCLAA